MQRGTSRVARDLQAGEVHNTTSSADFGPGDGNGFRHIKESHGGLDAVGVDVQGPACHCISEALGVWEVLCLKALVPLVQRVVPLLPNRLIPAAQPHDTSQD